MHVSNGEAICLLVTNPVKSLSITKHYYGWWLTALYLDILGKRRGSHKVFVGK
jgi:hypothetical protein